MQISIRFIHIIKIDISGIWGNASIHWENVDTAVNIIVGDNDSRKSTLLSILRDTLALNATVLKKLEVEVTLKMTEDIICFNRKKFTNKLSEERLKNVGYIIGCPVLRSEKRAKSILLFYDYNALTFKISSNETVLSTIYTYH